MVQRGCCIGHAAQTEPVAIHGPPVMPAAPKCVFKFDHEIIAVDACEFDQQRLDHRHLGRIHQARTGIGNRLLRLAQFDVQVAEQFLRLKKRLLRIRQAVHGL